MWVLWSKIYFIKTFFFFKFYKMRSEKGISIDVDSVLEEKENIKTVLMISCKIWAFWLPLFCFERCPLLWWLMLAFIRACWSQSRSTLWSFGHHVVICIFMCPVLSDQKKKDWEGFQSYKDQLISKALDLIMTVGILIKVEELSNLCYPKLS